MNNFGSGKAFFSILWLSVFSFILGCQAIPIREAVLNDDAGHEVSGQGAFKKEDLCSLLSREEVGAILKKKIEKSDFFINQCTYKVVQPSALEEFVIEISFDDGSGFNYNKKSGRERGRRIREVKGIGDAAYFDGGHLHVIKGNVWLIFFTGSSGKHPSENAMKALAKKAVDRLP